MRPWAVVDRSFLWSRSLDLVIVTTARTEESIFELIDQYVIPAVQKSQ